MPQIPGIPDDLLQVQGVQMTPPPMELLPSITDMVNKAAASMSDGETGRLVWLAQKRGAEKEVNLAIVSRLGEHVTITGWVGSKWGTPVSSGLVLGTGGAVSW